MTRIQSVESVLLFYLFQFQRLADANTVGRCKVVELSQSSCRYSVGSGDRRESVAFLDGVDAA